MHQREFAGTRCVHGEIDGRGTAPNRSQHQRPMEPAMKPVNFVLVCQELAVRRIGSARCVQSDGAPGHGSLVP